MELRYPKSTRFILLAALGFIFTSFSYLIFVYNPVEIIATKLIAIKPNSIAFYLWRNPPYETFVKIYIHNITNADGFLNKNEKLHFQEAGPYVYKEIVYNTNTSFNEDGTLSFIPHRLLQFIPELSVGDPHFDRVVTTNIPLLGITGSLEDYSFLVKISVAQIAYVIDAKPFLSLTVNDYLYGYDDTLVTLANNVVPNWIDFPRFGILDRLMAIDNGSDVVTITLNNSKSTSKHKNLLPLSIVKRNGSPGLLEWGYQENEGNASVTGNSECNTVQGCFIGPPFPPNVKKNTTFRLYRHGFCRPIPIKYESSNYSKNGFEGYIYRIKKDFLATPEENPGNACYCTKPKCLPKGLSDLSTCYYGIPVTLSLPHFLNGDPMLLEQVKGLSPNEDKHNSLVVIHPPTGVPLEATLKAQINLKVPTTLYNMRTKPFNNLIIPLFWVELVADSPPPKIILLLKLLYHFLPVIQSILKYVFAVLGATMICGCAVLIIVQPKNQQNEYLELPINYNEIEPFPITSKLLESKM